VDERFQLAGSSPTGGTSWLGLRVPSVATSANAPAGSPIYSSRYLFMGAGFSIGEGDRARIIGWRQFQSIGFLYTAGGLNRPIVLPVTTPGWTFPDGTVTTHLRRLGAPNAQGLPSFRPSNLTDGQSFRKGKAMTPALLYQTITLPAGDPYYVDLTAYSPPNGGRPYGTPLSDGAQLGTVYGLDTEWKTHGAWHSLDLEVDGPDTVAAFLSVGQTDPSTYPHLLPGVGQGPEDQFCATAFSVYESFPIWWSVGVALIAEIGPK